tara:strand:+ start:1283 stop:2518 length:1236 start_codon:yes stop_codon:yes gene_type:complete
MIFCKRCVYPSNHPLNITFDKDGICSGCRVHQEKDEIDWNERLVKLKTIVEPYRKSNRSINNCIVPVSGAQDSYYIVHIVKNILGLNPLLVTYNKHYNTLIGIRNLSYLKTIFGSPLITLTLSPQKVKKITRRTLMIMGSMYWHCIAGQTVFPVQMAYKYKIPLIIWGAHQGVDQVGMFSHLDEVEMTRKYRKEHDLMGFEAEDLVDKEGLMVQDLHNYFYPHDKEIEAVGIRGIYLNNYLRWDSKAQHELMIKLYGYETGLQKRTFDTYNNVDCYHYSGLHDLIKKIKWGYSKVYDHVSREIRLKRLTRFEGIKLVEKYNENVIDDFNLFCQWIDIDKEDMLKSLDKFRLPSIWAKKEDRWILKNNISNNKDDKKYSLGKIEECEFNSSSKRTNSPEIGKYTLIGRGWGK